MIADIVIRAKNGHKLTGSCIESIRKNTPDGSYRIILVDDGSDPPQDAWRTEFYLRSEKSRGAVSATNVGLSVSMQLPDTEYVIVMDNDTRVPDGDTGWLERFVAEMESFGPGCAVVGATTNYANRPQHILAVPQTYTGDWKDDEKGSGGSKNQPQAVWFVSFCAMLRKSAIRRVGLWDERFNPGNWEDTDYAVQLRAAGYRIHVAQSVYIHHEGHKTFGADIKNLLATNQQKFVEKWGPGRLWDMGLLANKVVNEISKEGMKREAS